MNQREKQAQQRIHNLVYGFDCDGVPAPSTFDPVHLPTRAAHNNKVVQVLSNIPEWLRAPKGTPALIRDALSLCTAGRLYRVYATYNHLRQVTRFVARPYYGGIWFPANNEIKLCDLEM